MNRTELASASSPVLLSMMIGEGKRTATVKCAQSTETCIRMDGPNQRVFNGTVKLDGRNVGPSEYALDEDASTITVKLSPGEHKVEISSPAAGMLY